MNRNWRNAQYSSRGNNNRDLSYSDGADRQNYDQMYNGNSENYDKQQDQDVKYINRPSIV